VPIAVVAASSFLRSCDLTLLLSGEWWSLELAEHVAGRAEQVGCQKDIAARAAPLRAALLARCDLLLRAAGCRITAYCPVV
jgi:hypothetical protein